MDMGMGGPGMGTGSGTGMDMGMGGPGMGTGSGTGMDMGMGGPGMGTGMPNTNQVNRQAILAQRAITKWRGPYLSDEMIPLDPWKNEYKYEYPTTRTTNGKPAVWSAGPDGLYDTEDDIYPANTKRAQPGQQTQMPGQGGMGTGMGMGMGGSGMGTGMDMGMGGSGMGTGMGTGSGMGTGMGTGTGGR